MKRVRARHGRVRAVVCLLLLLGICLRVRELHAELAPLAQPIVLPATDTLPGVVVYPARVPGSRPITVVLHGMCGAPEHACSHFAAQVTERENLICPRASERCDNGGASWSQRGVAEQIAAAVARAVRVLPAAPDEAHGRTLIGYSLGAFRALDVAQSAAGSYPRVMLIGAKVFPNAGLLRENGVRRLLLASGEWDMMHDHMQRESTRLARAGFPAAFLALGPVGHFFQPSFAEYLPRALGWLEQS